MIELKRIVIKPTLACTAKCIMCANRQGLYSEIVNEPVLTLKEWFKIIDDANDLGCKVVIISGGEPFLYKFLPELVDYIKRKRQIVVINTSGHGLDKNLLKAVCSLGVDDISIPLYSDNSQIHDSIRNIDGAFSSAIETIKFVSNECPNTKINSQCFLSSLNYRSLPGLMNLCIELKINQLDFTYIEGDFANQMQLNATELDEYINDILPKLKKKISTYVENSDEIIDKLTSVHNVPFGSFTKGIYQPYNSLPCKRPAEALLMVCNGDVLPCNMIEYTKEPIIGNLKISSLTEIWSGNKLKVFRNTHFAFCKNCPMPHYTKIKFNYTQKKF